ncbi:hypothetical protein [Mucilaginibacter aquaedulcis]|uniref:hypothetical protein n=1 Tax=Mucilaginibacter aquaedulcis TaxID=1187081 RepID=UPI0025B2C6EA|nr:hypothetical protein [Mucilaginibacter aquaedulcis]MDN3548471.1 hypothetical protein [Mucilaginibacter aquaedulcis]
MKHAFIFGTSIFLSNRNTLTVNDGEKNTEFLRVLSFYNHQKGSTDHLLTIDANITDLSGGVIRISNNQLEEGPANVHIETEPNRVWVFQKGNHEPLLDVYQLNEHEFHGLSSHILNEIEAQHPDAVVHIKGNFKASGVHFLIENEKMFVNNNGFANGVENAHDGIILTPGEAADY